MLLNAIIIAAAVTLSPPERNADGNWVRRCTVPRRGNAALLVPYSVGDCNESYLELFESVILLAPSYERFSGGGEVKVKRVPVFPAVYHGAVVPFDSFRTRAERTRKCFAFFGVKLGEMPENADADVFYCGGEIGICCDSDTF